MSSSESNDTDDVLKVSPKPSHYTVADYQCDQDAEVNRGRHLLGILAPPADSEETHSGEEYQKTEVSGTGISVSLLDLVNEIQNASTQQSGLSRKKYAQGSGLTPLPNNQNGGQAQQHLENIWAAGQSFQNSFQSSPTNLSTGYQPTDVLNPHQVSQDLRINHLSLQHPVVPNQLTLQGQGSFTSHPQSYPSNLHNPAGGFWPPNYYGVQMTPTNITGGYQADSFAAGQQLLAPQNAAGDILNVAFYNSTQGLPATVNMISEGMGPEVSICEPHLRGECQQKERCELNHYVLPYVWQINVVSVGWLTLPPDVVLTLEKAFCDVGKTISFTEMDLTYTNGVTNKTPLGVDFVNMKGEFNHPPHLSGLQRLADVRRLSTPTYGSRLIRHFSEEGATLEVSDGDKKSFLTQWRWFYQDQKNGAEWKMFEEDGLTPQQAVIESKFLAGQEVFFFEVEVSKNVLQIVLNFKALKMTNLKKKYSCPVRRRPVLVEPDDITMLCFSAWPEFEVNPFSQNVPSNWYPLQTKFDYELVPLNPEKMEFHLVASEFMKGVPVARIDDIFRLQNPFLWNKYYNKRLQFERKGKAREVQAFHGTDTEEVIKSILHQNFDWRMSGKNATAYGHGCYFAKCAGYSDKYTKPLSSTNNRSMFLARILVGKYCQGNKAFRRPPPIDPEKSHGELFDSCVDRTDNPRIYVIFDTDQCYPEYIINYKEC